MDLTNLPDEVILKLFSYLSIQDLGDWTKVSKRYRNICWDKALPYGEKKNIFVKTKAVEDSICDTEVAIRKLKDNVLAWRASLATSRPQQQQGQPGSAGQLGLAEQFEDLVANTKVIIRKLKNDVLAWRASVAPSGPQQQQGQPGSAGQPGPAEQLEDLVANTEVEIRKLKNDVLLWRASVSASGQPAEQLEDLLANTEVEITKVASRWSLQKLTIGSLNKPTQSHLMQLIAALKNPNYNIHQQQQHVMNILRANPKLMAAFLKVRNQQQQQQGGTSGQ